MNKLFRVSVFVLLGVVYSLSFGLLGTAQADGGDNAHSIADRTIKARAGDQCV